MRELNLYHALQKTHVSEDRKETHHVSSLQAMLCQVRSVGEETEVGSKSNINMARVYHFTRSFDF